MITDKTYKVLRIVEEDFGCEGRPDGQEPEVEVHLLDKKQQESVVRMKDALLYERDIDEADDVYVGEDGSLYLVQ